MLFLLSYLTDNGNLKGINDATFSLLGRMCGTAMFVLYCWASIDLLRWEKLLSPLDFSSLHTRHRFFFFQKGEYGDGCCIYRISILSVEPLLKRKNRFCCLHFFGVVVLQCVRQETGFYYHEAVSSAAIHTYNTVTPRHNATKPSLFLSHCDPMNAASTIHVVT